MTQGYISLRARLLDRFPDYLKIDHIPYDPPGLTICPKCHKNCGILLSQYWRCDKCGIHGDVVDYVMINNHFSSPEQAIRHLCRMLGVKNTQFEAVSAEEILDMEFTDPVFLVDGLLSNGLHILAGPSKSGKSWLALWMAHRISTGQPIWDHPVRQGEVLYLSLEDPLARVQRRLMEVTNGTTGKIWVVTEAEMIGNGLEEQLIGFLSEHPGIRLVLIDTLQKVRDMKSVQYCYAGDYSTMSSLKNIADRFGIAILLIHHTRKQPSSDPFDMISGTTGLMGCADSSFVLLKESRISVCAELFGTGRDIEDLHLSLRFSAEQKCWELVDSHPVREEPSRFDRILQLVRDFSTENPAWKGTASALLSALKEREPDLDLAPNVLVRVLNSGASALQSIYKVAYHSLPKHGGMKMLALNALPKDDPDPDSPDTQNTGNIVPIDLEQPKVS